MPRLHGWACAQGRPFVHEMCERAGIMRAAC